MTDLYLRCSGSFIPATLEDFVGAGHATDRLTKETSTGARLTASTGWPAAR